MGLFDKKICAICGGDIGLLGNRKLADGNMCKHCAEKMSVFLTDRKEWTVEEMMGHLAYRDDNYQRLSTFMTSTVIGGNQKLYIDAANMQWFVTRSNDYMRANPDIFFFNQITGCNMEIRESTTEVFFVTPDGHREPYYPPEYDYDYDFFITIYVNSPLVSQISLRLNDFTIHDDLTPEYKQCEADAYAMKSILDQMASGVAALNIPGQLIIDSAMRADLDRQRIERDRAREMRRKLRPGGPRPSVPHPGPHVPPPMPHAAGPRPAAPHPGPHVPPPMPHAPGPRPAAPHPAGPRPTSPHPTAPRPVAPHPASDRIGEPRKVTPNHPAPAKQTPHHSAPTKSVPNHRGPGRP